LSDGPSIGYGYVVNERKIHPLQGGVVVWGKKVRGKEGEETGEGRKETREEGKGTYRFFNFLWLSPTNHQLPFYTFPSTLE
jgi:hypothetical protein